MFYVDNILVSCLKNILNADFEEMSTKHHTSNPLGNLSGNNKKLE